MPAAVLRHELLMSPEHEMLMSPCLHVSRAPPQRLQQHQHRQRVRHLPSRIAAQQRERRDRAFAAEFSVIIVVQAARKLWHNRQPQGPRRVHTTRGLCRLPQSPEDGRSRLPAFTAAGGRGFPEPAGRFEKGASRDVNVAFDSGHHV